MANNVKFEDIKILYEDNHILVVVKPFNVPVQADESGDADMLNLLKAYLVKKYNKPGEAFLGLVHRLDRPTGGVMVFAKTTKAASRLSESLREGGFEKKYLAVTHGTPKNRQESLVHYLKKSPDLNSVFVVPMTTEGAKRAELEYSVLTEKGDLCLLKLNLLTGRSHQIRVQLATIGTPIVGDRRYGSDQKTNVQLALWATQLKFTHPITGERLVFRVYPPEDLPPWNQFDLETFLSLTIKN